MLQRTGRFLPSPLCQAFRCRDSKPQSVRRKSWRSISADPARRAAKFALSSLSLSVRMLPRGFARSDCELASTLHRLQNELEQNSGLRDSGKRHHRGKSLADLHFIATNGLSGLLVPAPLGFQGFQRLLVGAVGIEPTTFGLKGFGCKISQPLDGAQLTSEEYQKISLETDVFWASNGRQFCGGPLSWGT
jgi:hypothetical protein